MREGRRLLQDVLTLTSHTTDRKTPTNKALEPPAGSAHDDALILRQPGGQQRLVLSESTIRAAALELLEPGSDELGTLRTR